MAEIVEMALSLVEEDTSATSENVETEIAVTDVDESKSEAVDATEESSDSPIAGADASVAAATATASASAGDAAGLQLGPRHFADRSACVDYFRTLLQSPSPTQLGGDDLDVVTALLSRHTNAKEKIGCGVSFIFVDKHPNFDSCALAALHPLPA